MPVLYHLSLQKPTAAVAAVHGSFSAPRVQEVVVNRGRLLELLRPDEEGKLHSICSTDVFGIIRSIATFRLTGALTDYIVLGSDSGRLVIVEFDAKNNLFKRVHCETFGKTGVRRVVAGEYVAVDPRGRALMVAAVERQKFVFVLNRDAKAAVTISSPLEAHKSHIACLDLCGLDVGFENPLFATLEQPYPQPHKGGVRKSPRVLCFWEMDLGLNHVVKKASQEVPESAHLLVPVPGGGPQEGPGGVLVCCSSSVEYRKLDHAAVCCSIPRRLEVGGEQEVLICCYAAHRMKGFFFILLQSELGDLFKIEVTHAEGTVQDLSCRYFDSLPAAANSLCVLRSGYLFAAAEFGPHRLYQFTGIGTAAADPRCSASHPLGAAAVIAFKPRPLRNLLLSDLLPSASPVLDLQVLDAQGTGGAPQLYLLCGRGPLSALKVLQRGLGVEELADNELPGFPRGLWTLRESPEGLFHKFILVAFEGSTLVLQVGDTVEEVSNTPFAAAATTLLAALFADGSYVQVLEHEVRHIRGAPGGPGGPPGSAGAPGGAPGGPGGGPGAPVAVWRPPGDRRIRAAAANQQQLLLALSGGDVLLLELDELGALEETARKQLHVEVSCLALLEAPEGRSRGPFLAVGALDNVVRVLSAEKEKQMKQLSVLLLPANATPESVCLAAAQPRPSAESSIYLYVGLSSGVMLRSSVDPTTGALGDQRCRFLGAKAPQFARVAVSSKPAVAALSEKTWLKFCHQGKLLAAPLHYDPLDAIASFSSEQCLDGFVAISGNSLRIFRVPRLGDVFCSSSLPLSFTPRAMAVLPHVSEFGGTLVPAEGSSQKVPALAICEADHNAYDEATKFEIQRALRGIKLSHEEENEEVNGFEEESALGAFKAGSGKWGSCLRVVNPLLSTTIEKVTFETDEAAISCCCCEFEGLPLLIVGTVTAMSFRPKKIAAASIKVYAYDSNFRLTFLHSTPVEGPPQCFSPFRGMLLAGVGNRLRLYALGKKRLLKKCEYKNLPSGIVFLKVCGDRIFAGDMSESIHVIKYKANANLFYVLCDDTGPRWLTRGEVLDYHSIVAADKFDSIFIERVPSEARQDEGGDSTGLKLRGDTAYMTDSCHKLDTVLQFHVGETVTGLRRATLSTGASEAIVYATIMGTIGALVPFLTKEELDFFHHLEMVMRNEAPPLAGRDHLMFRSYYHPLKNVVDGDLCEQYGSLPPAVQTRIAEDFEKTPAEILKRLEDIRNRVL